MTKRGVWQVGTLALATAAVVTAFLPSWRLGQERAAARAEGLALTLDELRVRPPVLDAENAAPLLRMARLGWVRTGAYLRGLPILKEDSHVIAGTGSAKERAEVFAWSQREAPNLAQWRLASRRPRVDYGDRARFRWSEYGIDLIEDRYAAASLVAAAAVGQDVRENLQAAARLSALMRSEGEIHSASRGALLGVECLKVAERTGLMRETFAALGPPTDVRAALRPALPQLLELLRRARSEFGDRKGWRDWLDRVVSPAGAAETSAIAQWRALWRALPPGDDYVGAARVCDARLPKMMELTAIGVGPRRMLLGGGGKDTGSSLRAVAWFERMRARLADR